MKNLSRPLRCFAHSLIATAVVTTSFSASANRTIASVRVAPAKRGSLRPLSARERAILQRAALDLIVENFQKSRDFDSFDRNILSQLPERDHKALAAEFKTLKEWPNARRVGSRVFFDVGNEHVTLEIPDPSYPVMSFNGMTWTFNSRQPLAYQLQLALRNYDYQKHPSSAFLYLALPEAFAQAAAEASAGALDTAAAAGETAAGAAGVAAEASGAVSTAGKLLKLVTGTRGVIAAAAVTTLVSLGVTTAVTNVTCHFVGGSKLETEWGFCYDWRKQLDDARKRRTEYLGRVDALDKGKTQTEENATLKWVPDITKTCLTLADKTKSLYVIDFLELRRGAGDAWEKDGDWFSIVQKYNPDGKPSQFVITAKGTDVSNAKWKDNAVETVNFEEGHMSSILYKNSEYNKNDPASPPWLKQDVVATNDGQLSDVQIARQNAMNALVRSVHTWANYCSEKKFVDDLQKQNVPTENPNPSPQIDPHTVLPSADAPPAAVPNAATSTVTH